MRKTRRSADGVRDGNAFWGNCWCEKRRSPLKKHLASRRIVLWGMLAVGTAGAVLAQEEQPLAAGNEALLTLAYPVKKAATPITPTFRAEPVCAA